MENTLLQNYGSAKFKSIYSLDIMKFVLALFVVQIHSSGYTILFHRFAVPFFFTISGYLFFRGYRNKRPGRERIYSLFHFLKRLFLLWSFWFIVQLPYIYMVRKSFFDNFFHGDIGLLFLMMFNSTFIGSWYLTAMFSGMILVCIMSAFLNKYVVFGICFILYLLAVISSYDIPIGDFFQHIFDPLGYLCVQPQISFLVSMVFLMVGKIMAESTLKFSIKKLIIVEIVLIFLILIEFFCKNNVCLFIFCMCITIPFLYTTLQIVLYYSPDTLPTAKEQMCLFCRRSSTIMYCCHGGAACLLRFILYNTVGKNAVVKFFMFPLTLCIALGIAFFITKAVKMKYFKWLKYSY